MRLSRGVPLAGSRATCGRKAIGFLAVLAISVALIGITPAKVVRGDDGAEMVLVPAGEFWMGSNPAEVEKAKEDCKKQGVAEASCKGWIEREQPRHRVYVDGFHIDRYEVSNALFERFTRATSHRTTAEREGNSTVWQQKDGKGR